MRFVVCLAALMLSTASAAQSTVTSLRKGSLTKVEIADVIRKHLAPIKACYEGQLTETPNLRGKITTRFLVAGTGVVQSVEIAKTTMNHAPTERCLAQIIKGMRFPEPRGGGIVQVVYPFMFQKAVQVKKAKISQRNEQLAPELHRQRNIALGVTVLGSGLAASGWLLQGPDGQQLSGLLLSGVAVMGVGIGGVLWTQLK